MLFAACRFKFRRGLERSFLRLTRQFDLMICIHRQAIALRHFRETDEASTVFASTINGGFVLSGAMAKHRMSRSPTTIEEE